MPPNAPPRRALHRAATKAAPAPAGRALAAMLPALAAALALLLALPGFAQEAAPAVDTPAAAPAATAPAAPAPAADAPAPPKEAVRAPGTYTLDPEHTHVVYTFDHLGFSTSTGLIRGITGTVVLDPAAPEKSSVEASFPLSALTTVSASLDRELGSDAFFKGAPPDTAITFTSTKVEPKGADKAEVTGDLTLNGVTRPLVLQVTLRQMGDSPMTKKPAAGFVATGTLKRSDFNLGAFAPAVSDEVQLTINAEAQKG